VKIANGGTSDLGKIKDKDMVELILIARAAGWLVWKTKRSHLRFRPPAPAGSPCPDTGDHEDHRGGGRTLTHGTTDSDVYGMKKFRADLRRAGLEGV
jgi:hypothetical protein